jgi:hypothetical protein
MNVIPKNYGATKILRKRNAIAALIVAQRTLANFIITG